MINAYCLPWHLLLIIHELQYMELSLVSYLVSNQNNSSTIDSAERWSLTASPPPTPPTPLQNKYDYGVPLYMLDSITISKHVLRKSYDKMQFSTLAW